jgi:hypothetical protein
MVSKLAILLLHSLRAVLNSHQYLLHQTPGMARSPFNLALKFGTQFRSRKSFAFAKYSFCARDIPGIEARASGKHRYYQGVALNDEGQKRYEAAIEKQGFR